MRSIMAAAAALWLAGPFSAPPSLATATATYTVGPIRIETPWTRVAPRGFRVAGGFMRITNTGTAPDRLIGGSLVAAQRFEVHEMAMDGGQMRMRELAGGLEIKPGETVELKPGSFHVMFMEMTAPLEQGGKVKGTLVFEKAGTVEVEYIVHALGTMSADGKQRAGGDPSGGGHGGHGGHGQHGGHGAPKRP